MKESLQSQVDELCVISDEVVKEPSKKIENVIKELGYSATYIGLASVKTIALDVSGVGVAGVVTSLLNTNLLFTPAAISLPVIGFFTLIGLKKKQKEKEMMYRKIIAKQQAVINELKKRNTKTEEELKNLENMMDMLINMQTCINEIA